ncbi:hypothetical protein DSO57_1015870 [Entomophthora muscae]|uniref:Uncharacterized protein n=1 Tax=Entomophthora muscae TaxID=34485 RepID=A0ACC2UPV9_9FUNG|nr:hypothetical protein DSO57_1015870 [Entomophthora muscae]
MVMKGTWMINPKGQDEGLFLFAHFRVGSLYACDGEGMSSPCEMRSFLRNVEFREWEGTRLVKSNWIRVSDGWLGVAKRGKLNIPNQSSGDGGSGSGKCDAECGRFSIAEESLEGKV